MYKCTPGCVSTLWHHRWAWSQETELPWDDTPAPFKLFNMLTNSSFLHAKCYMLTVGMLRLNANVSTCGLISSNVFYGDLWSILCLLFSILFSGAYWPLQSLWLQTFSLVRYILWAQQWNWQYNIYMISDIHNDTINPIITWICSSHWLYGAYSEFQLIV